MAPKPPPGIRDETSPKPVFPASPDVNFSNMWVGVTPVSVQVPLEGAWFEVKKPEAGSGSPLLPV